MFSECEDDLCIFVCGTCKRYFMQLSAFSQHKKEQSCKRKSPGTSLLNDNALGHNSTQETAEETEPDENMTASSCENFNDNEDNSPRKLPRKQDKKLIKRTIRELENENLLSPEGKLNVNTLFPSVSHDVSHENTLASPDLARSCKHPVYVCKTCHAEFPNTNGRVFKCVDCRRGFYTEADLNQHMVRAKHNNLCAVCGKIFPDKYKLRKHELSHVTEKNFRCEEPGCTKSFKSAEDVRTHVRYVHAVEKRFHCTQCTKAFTRLDKFKQHMHTHGISLKPGPISPSQSSGVGNNLLSLGSGIGSNPPGQTPGTGNNILALKSSPPEEPIATETMSLYQGISALNDAEVVQTAELPAITVNSHPSPGHERAAVTSEADIIGQVDKSEVGSGIVPCSSSRNFNNSANVDDLGKSTDGQNNNQSLKHRQSSGLSQSECAMECEKCRSRFQTSVEFLAHEERRADHVLRCENCSGKFLSYCELRSHVMHDHGAKFLTQVETKPPPPETPKKVRKHFCQECGKGFTRADKLKRHVVIHSPDRPSVPCSCKESHGCERTFYRNDSMKRHALTHSLEKPYTCEECGKNFSRPDYLTKHVGHVHKRAFKHLCTLCDYGTREAKRLKIHIRSKHDLDPDLLLSTDSSETSLGPSMANPVETVTRVTPESPMDSKPPEDIDQPTRGGLTSPVEPVGQDIGDMNPGPCDPTSINSGEFSPHDISPGKLTPQDLTSTEVGSTLPNNMNTRVLVQHTGEMAPNGGQLNPNIGETTPSIEATNSAVIEPLTNELSPPEMHQHTLDMSRHHRDVTSPSRDLHQATGHMDHGDRFQHSGIETPGSLGSPSCSESASPVTRQSVISQDLSVPELRLLPDFQDVPRHDFNGRPFLGDQSPLRSRFPYSYPPQDLRPQYSMQADFSTMNHQTGLTQFPPHQSVFSNVHMQFPGGGHLSTYERKTPLNSRPVSSQSPFNWRT